MTSGRPMSEYVRQELLDAWIVAHDKQKARAEAAEAKVARARTIATRYAGSTNPALFMARDLTAALADEEDDR